MRKTHPAYTSVDAAYRHNSQRGYILLPVVLALALLAAIAWLINREGAIHADMVTATTESVQVEQVARAGFAHASWGANTSGCAGDMALPTLPFGEDGNDSYSATVTTPGGGTSASILSVDQDAWFRSDQPDVNNGASDEMHLRKGAGVGTEVAMYRFDLSSLPAGAQINSASAWFYVTFTPGKDGGPYPEGPLTVHTVTEGWVETGPTWNNMNTAFNDEIIAVMPAETDAFVWVRVNLTAQVQAWVNGAEPNYGIMIWPTGEGTHAKLVSKEGPVSQRPRLEVVVGTGPPSPATITATGTLANGNTRTLTRTDVPAYQLDSYTSMQPGDVSGEDAEIWEQAPGNNYGNAQVAWVSSASSDTTRTLLRFNMGAIPAAARILGATLSLHRKGGVAGVDEPVSAHRIRNSWREDSVTWNQRETGTNWDTPGADFDSMAVATTVVGPGDLRYEWSITPLAQGWVDGSYPNYGVALVSAIAGMAGKEFYTSDHNNSDWHPRLTITYACECGSPCVGSQGGGKLLLVTADVAPNKTEAGLIARFESWGYTVDTLDMDSDQAAFDIKIDLSDVAFIPGTTDKLKVGNKLTNTAIGVVSVHGDMNENLGMATSRAWPMGTGMTIIDTSHFITAPLPAGPVEIYSAAMEGMTVAGSEAPGLQTLADWGVAGSLVVLDRDATTTTGSPAKGRRVMLPLGRADSFNWDYLTNSGQLLVQRALQWGAVFTGAAVPDYYLDRFNSLTCNDAYDYAGSDGTLDWSGQLWSEIGDSGGTCNGPVKLVDDLGNTVVRLVSPDTGLQRPVDLTPLPVAWLHLDYRRVNFDSATDMISVSVSDDGGGNWTEVAQLAGPANDLVYQRADIDISDYAEADAVIRFEVLNTHTNGSEPVYIDNVQIDNKAIPVVAAKKLLFVVKDAPSLTTEEAAHRSLVESWGYSVALIDDQATQGDFDTKVAANEVVFLTNDVDSAAVGSKLVNAGIGVVTSEVNLSDEFGLSSSIDWDTGKTITVVDSTHYITAPFSTGSLTILSAPESLAYVTGTKSPDLQKLASSTFGYGVVTLAAGAATYTGGTAAGRRVQLPWGGNGLHPDDLNDNAKAILLRALAWGMGTGADTGSGGGGGGSCAGTFRDEFGLVDYSNSDGSLGWGGDWVEGGESTDPGANEIRIENDVNNYQLRLKKENRSVTRPLDMSGYTSATLSFISRRDGVESGKYLALEATANGTDWIEVGRLEGPADEASYQTNSFDISGYISNLSAIRFVTGAANGKNDLFFLDNIQVCVN